MSSNIPIAPQGNVPVIGIPDSQDIPRLVFTAPYFEQSPLAELIAPTVTEAVEAQLPSLVPPYVDAAAQAAVQQLAVLLTGSTMSGPLFLSPLMPTQPSQAATMAYVDSMIATAGIPEVPPVPSGQVWARETGQWVPITPQTGVFLPLSGGIMTGNINMSGNTIQNMAAVPAMPNGAAPAQWVLNQIASVSLYQGTWDADNNVPDLTQLSTHVNAYTWIAVTTSVSGVVIGPAIPGLQGLTVFNGDTIIYSTVQGQFMSIHAGGITLPEADGRYVQLAGSQMSGALLLNANASQPLQAVTYQQLEAFVPPGAVGEAPNDGQLYGRNGLTHAWSPVLPLAGGILTGALTLSGNATANLNPVPLQQMTTAITAATAGYLPLSGAAMTGLMTLSGNASVSLNPVPLQQLNSMLGAYAALSGAVFTGPVVLPTGSTIAGYLPLSGGTLTGALTLSGTNGLTVGGNISAAGGAVALTTGGITTASGVFSAGMTVNGAGAQVALQVPNGGATFGGTTAGGQVVNHGSFISEVAGNGSSFSCYNTTANQSCGIYGAGNGTQLFISSMSAVGAPIANWQIHSGGGFLPAADDTQVCGIAGGAWNSVASYAFAQQSDPRLKKDIAAAPEGALAHVMAIPVQNFRWLKEDESAPLHIGWMASDVQNALGPGSATVDVGTDENQTLSLNTNEMVAVLWQAVQELKAEVEAR